ncbi:hypothetical protein Hanom_Chr11g01032631 [Helianthus anomalus]
MLLNLTHVCGLQIDLRDAHFLAFASENQFLELDYEDYGVGSNNNIVYLRFMALILSEKQASCHKFYKRSYKLIIVSLNQMSVHVNIADTPSFVSHKRPRDAARRRLLQRRAEAKLRVLTGGSMAA